MTNILRFKRQALHERTDKAAQREAEEVARLREAELATEAARARLAALHDETERVEHAAQVAAARHADAQREKEARWKTEEEARLQALREQAAGEEARVNEARLSIASLSARQKQLQVEADAERERLDILRLEGRAVEGCWGGRPPPRSLEGREKLASSMSNKFEAEAKLEATAQLKKLEEYLAGEEGKLRETRLQRQHEEARLNQLQQEAEEVQTFVYSTVGSTCV